jgi:D-arginine dehydrogenase
LPSRDNYDVVIIGAGIAGTALAHFLGERGVDRILVLERETQPGRGATGRSAATLMEYDTNAVVQQLKVLGGNFLRDPPEEFATRPLVDERGVLVVFDEAQWEEVERRAADFDRSGMTFELMPPDEATFIIDTLIERAFAGAMLLPRCGCIDVHELLTSYVRHSRDAGTDYLFGVEVTGIRPGAARGLEVTTPAGVITAETVVDAAGAWCGLVGEMADATPLEFRTLRRSLVSFAAPVELEVHRWPVLWSESHHFYFRPDATGLLFCPMDEEPMPPGEVSPTEEVLAEGIERLRALTPRLVPHGFARQWAGLRTFSADRAPVVGWDPDLEGFFWLAGQGGCGIETSSILGEIAADLITEGRTSRFDAAVLSPERFG